MRRTTTDPTEVKEALEKWAEVTATPAFPGSGEGTPASLKDSRRMYEQWLDRAKIPIASASSAAKAEQLLSRPIERLEFDKHLNKKAGMAAGTDGCTWELLQKLRPETPAGEVQRISTFPPRHVLF
eukprot:gene11007-biopygen9401